jgi:hypothetical protein
MRRCIGQARKAGNDTTLPYDAFVGHRVALALIADLPARRTPGDAVAEPTADEFLVVDANLAILANDAKDVLVAMSAELQALSADHQLFVANLDVLAEALDKGEAVLGPIARRDLNLIPKFPWS